MKNWEYLLVLCSSVHINSDTKEVYVMAHNQSEQKIVSLDPKYDWKAKGYNLVFSKYGNYWTYPEKYLNELGNNGWEVVGVTPPWYIDGNNFSTNTTFHIILKRSKT